VLVLKPEGFVTRRFAYRVESTFARRRGRTIKIPKGE
jgi:hypothetical protein